MLLRVHIQRGTWLYPKQCFVRLITPWYLSMRHNQVYTKRNVLKFATAWPGIIACLSAKEGWRELRSHWLAWSQWLVESVWWVTAFDCLFGTFMTVRPCDIERVFRWGAVSAAEDLNTWWGFWLATWAVGSGDELGGYKVRTVARKRCSSFLLSISLEDHQSHASYSHHLFSLPSVEMKTYWLAKILL